MPPAQESCVNGCGSEALSVASSAHTSCHKSAYASVRQFSRRVRRAIWFLKTVFVGAANLATYGAMMLFFAEVRIEKSEMRLASTPATVKNFAGLSSNAIDRTPSI